jgi:hypothetical protein
MSEVVRMIEMVERTLHSLGETRKSNLRCIINERYDSLIKYVEKHRSQAI